MLDQEDAPSTLVLLAWLLERWRLRVTVGNQSKLSRLESGKGVDDARVLRAVAAELQIPLESLGLTAPNSADLRTDDMHRRGFLAAGVAALATPARPHAAGLELVQALLPTAAPLPDRRPLTEEALRGRLSQARRLF